MFYRSARGCIIRSCSSDATKSSCFFLCRICVLIASGEERVNAAEEERALTGTWEMDEVRLAVEKDYMVVVIYEFYEYQVTQYNPVTGEGGLFVD